MCCPFGHSPSLQTPHYPRIRGEEGGGGGTITHCPCPDLMVSCAHDQSLSVLLRAHHASLHVGSLPPVFRLCRCLSFSSGRFSLPLSLHHCWLEVPLSKPFDAFDTFTSLPPSRT